MATLLIILYLIAAFITFGIMLKVDDEEYSGHGLDIGGCLFFAAIWPVAALASLGYLIAHKIYKWMEK